MVRQGRAALAACLALLAAASLPATPPESAQATAPVPRVMIEIYRIAPGEQRNFLKLIARYDEANHLAGLPPRQLYVHQDGASWDFIIIQPAETAPARSKALQAASKQVGLPQGANAFFEIRRFIAEHTDTSALGPTTAAAWLGEAQ